MSQRREHKKRKLIKLKENPKLIIDDLQEKINFLPKDYQRILLTQFANDILDDMIKEIVFKHTLDLRMKEGLRYVYTTRKNYLYFNKGFNRVS